MKDHTAKKPLWEIELCRVDWARLRDIRVDLPGGFVGAEYVPDAVRGLLGASNINEANKHYERLDNHVVVQGATYEAAEYVVGVLTAALHEPLPEYVMWTILDLLFDMTAYYSANDKIEEDLTERCRVRAREGIWRLYELFMEEPGKSEVFLDLLEKIETDPYRFRSFIEAKKRTGWLVPVRLKLP